MDEEHVACPAAPGSVGENSTVRPVRHGGRDGAAPSRPVLLAGDPIAVEGRRDGGGLWIAVEREGPVRIVHVAGELELAGLRPVVARLFAVTGVDPVLRIHPDFGAARAQPDSLPEPESKRSHSSEPGRSSEEESPEEVSSAHPGAPRRPV
ncbi:hypothetical protein [Kitasatospora sp. NPDC001683]